MVPTFDNFLLNFFLSPLNLAEKIKWNQITIEKCDEGGTPGGCRHRAAVLSEIAAVRLLRSADICPWMCSKACSGVRNHHVVTPIAIGLRATASTDTAYQKSVLKEAATAVAADAAPASAACEGIFFRPRAPLLLHCPLRFGTFCIGVARPARAKCVRA